MEVEKSSSGLVRSLSLKDAVMIGIASMIGGAIFVLVGPGMAQAGAALMIAFLLNGVITVFTALTYAELGSAFPATGGGYRWVKQGLPRPNAYLSGWMAWFGHTIAGSLYAVAFGSFFGYLLQASGVIGDDFGFPIDKLFAAIAIIIFIFVNIRGASDTGKVGNAITFTQLAIIGVLVAAAVGAMAFANPNWSENFTDFMPLGITGIALAMGLTFIAFEGYEIISQAGDEIKNPKRNIPRAILLSLAIVVTLYVVFTFVFIGGLNPDDIGMPAWSFIGSFGELGIIEAAERFMPFGALIVLAGGLVSTLSALNATTFAASRVSFAMGTQYNLPHIFSKIHPKYHTPFVATIISGIIMMVIALSLDLTAIALAASIMFLFLFTQVNLASITIRRLYEKTVDYGFKTPFFPAVPIIGIVTAMGLSIYLLIAHPESWVIAVVWVLIGFVIYKFYTSKQELEHNAPLVFTQGPKLRKEYRIMIVFDKRNATKFYKIAKAISEQNDGEITVLNIVNVPRQTPLSLSHGIGDNGLKAIEEFKRAIPGSLRNRFLVRLAHDPTEAILSTAEEQDINTMLVDFSFLRNNRKLLSLTTCDIIGIRLRKHFDQDISQMIISYDKGRHSDLGLEIGHALSATNDSKIRIVRGVVEDPDDEVEVVNRINDKMLDLDLKRSSLRKCMVVET
uniref:Cationic amino acid transporter n=1 Tax=uncultured marine thaumarchaeote AD1000_72_F04 TaxID=1455938 RepID=A0A075FWJ2_9ARCH|nr:cationic amino acid transporter [uncultured marine thaumarchaeote AD1000_72_F04]